MKKSLICLSLIFSSLSAFASTTNDSAAIQEIKQLPNERVLISASITDTAWFNTNKVTNAKGEKVEFTNISKLTERCSAFHCITVESLEIETIAGSKTLTLHNNQNQTLTLNIQ